MCGIVGYVGGDSCAPLLLDGLRRLEYRGYDSAGLAIVHDGRVGVLRTVGKLRNLEAAHAKAPLPGSLGVGHTRWATHGSPSEVNAHPHVSGPIAVVHNGIIENHGTLRKKLEALGTKILSDTDTEIAAHLVASAFASGMSLTEAVRSAMTELEGAYAIAVVSAAVPDQLVVAKKSSPLVLGIGEGATFCGSDIPALLPHTRSMMFLEDGDIATLGPGTVAVTDLTGNVVSRPIRVIDWSPVMAEKSGYKHFMLKEIVEQPRAMEDTLRGRLDRERGCVVASEIGLDDNTASAIQRVVLLACGTSHHAAMLGRHYIETLVGVAATVELASEFRGRDPVIGAGDLVIAVSQSGETLDTLEAARLARTRGAHILAIANVIGSAITRVADASFYTHAGPEIGVASTKCFTTQVLNLLLFALWFGRTRGTLSAEHCRVHVEDLAKLPAQMTHTIQETRQLCANLARRHSEARDVLFLGRGLSFPIALEGALKLKEISYVHAEGYAAGEMKHGPIALIDGAVPVVVICPNDTTYEKTLSNLQEAKARGAPVIAIGTAGDENLVDLSEAVIETPKSNSLLSPFLTVLPLQLFAYYVADFKGTDVDQPRNLAKTVTVE